MNDPRIERQQALRDLVDAELEVSIDKIGWRGEGLVRFADGWLSIRGVHAGEVARVRCAADLARPGKLYATLQDVVVASESRVDAGCTNFPRCAGCHLRHYSRSDELDFKRDGVLEILHKFSDFDVREVPEVEIVEGAADGARRRGSIARVGDHFGLRVPGESAVIDMGDCPALTSEAQELVRAVVAAVLESGAPTTRIQWAQSQHGGWVDIDSGAPLLSNLLSDYAIEVSRNDPASPVPTTTLEIERLGWNIEEAPGAWSHTTAGPSEALYRWCGELLQDTNSVLDLGCGVGTLSLLAGKLGAVRVVGVDASRTATALARRNTRRHGVNAEFLTGDFEKVTRDLALTKREFHTTIINPMREPVGQRVVGYIDRITTERVVYLAPSPAAGTRDLELLRQCGWDALVRLSAIDLHPKTYHVMMGAVLARGG